MADPKRNGDKQPYLIIHDTSPPSRGQNAKLFVKQFLSTYWSRLLMFAIFIIALRLHNAIGFVYGAITVIALLTDRKSNWGNVWISYAFVSFIVIGVQIYFLAASHLNQNIADLAAWIGLDLTFREAIPVFLLNLLIFGFSFIELITGTWIYIIMSDQEYEAAKQKYKPILHLEQIQEQQEQEGALLLNQDENINQEQLIQEFQYIKARYYFKRIDVAVEDAYHRHGYELSLLFLLVAAFYRLNVASIIYVIIAAYFSLSSKYFYDQEKYGKNLSKFKVGMENSLFTSSN
jgi:hypothetical protein